VGVTNSFRIENSSMPSPPPSIGQKALVTLVGFLTASAIYLYAFPQPNVVYAVVVLLHLVGGILATLLLLPLLGRLWREGSWLTWGGWFLFLAGAALGLWLVHTGSLRSQWEWMYAHMLVCAGALGFLMALLVFPPWKSRHVSPDLRETPRDGLAGIDFASLGIPTEDEYVAAYCRRTDRASISNYSFYIAFNFFRMAAIFHGIKGRVIRGTAASAEAADRATKFPLLADLACTAMEECR